ncbi:MAG: hypothetical protein KBT00_05930 [Bacteroidales bacterium]|nr:hypothetical protein [Candidatus Cacconaster merdequi]
MNILLKTFSAISLMASILFLSSCDKDDGGSKKSDSTPTKYEVGIGITVSDGALAVYDISGSCSSSNNAFTSVNLSSLNTAKKINQSVIGSKFPDDVKIELIATPKPGLDASRTYDGIKFEFNNNINVSRKNGKSAGAVDNDGRDVSGIAGDKIKEYRYSVTFSVAADGGVTKH